MSILFTDLDNTLIYSHHRKISEPKAVVVEHLDGRAQAFMTGFSYQFLAAADWLTVVPVTTRTARQYQRIECAPDLRFRYAIVCNGGKLLVDGKEDEAWSHETLVRTRDYYNSLEQASGLMSRLCAGSTVHRPEDYMSYVKCGDPERIYGKLTESVNPARVDVQRAAGKVYLLAKGISKGTAVERFLEKWERETVLAAGDSWMDIPMLDRADFAFAAPEIYGLVTCRNKIKIEDRPLSDGICRYLGQMKRKGIL